MKKINLNSGLPIYCLKEKEAIVLDEHINGYLSYGVKINKDNTIIDIGANIGVFGLRLSHLFPSLHIHAFEPIPEIHSVLKKNTQLSGNNNFHAYMMGVSNKETELSFTYYPNSPALSTSNPEIWNTNKTSFIAAVEGNIVNAGKQFWWAKYIPTWISPLIARYLMANSKIIKSKVTSLSNFINAKQIKEINLLKVDCEGEEINVLLGIEDQHWNIIKAVIMEVIDIDNNVEKANKILLKKGFKNINLEKEKGFEETDMVNIYATKY